MGYINNWLNEFLQSKQVDVIVDDTLSDLRRREKILDAYMPLKMYDSRNFLGLLTNKVNPIASVIAYGAEIPLTSFGGIRKVTAELCKIALARAYDENIQWMMYDAMKLANVQNLKVQNTANSDGSVIRGVDNDLAAHIFGSIEDMVKAVVDRIDSMAWQVVQTGSVDIDDQRTGVRFTVDYKDAGADYDHFPAALTQTGNIVDPKLNRWSDYEHAQGLQNLYDAVDRFNDTNGTDPEMIVMSRKLLNHLMNQKSTKDAASHVTTKVVGLVSPELLGELLRLRGIPPIITMDEKYQEETPEKKIVNARFLNTDRFCFLNKNMGERAMGPVMESANHPMVGTDVPRPKSGIYTRTFEKEKSPILDVTEAIATALPIVVDPKKLFSWQVG